MKLTPIIRYYLGKTNNKRIDMNALDDMKWKTSFKNKGSDFEFSFSAVREIYENASVGVKIEIDDWSKDNYVLMPAAAYNGNRFVTFKQTYPPLIRDRSAFRVDMPVYQNDVPRLNIDPGNSIIEQLAGDMSIPCIGVFFPKKLKALFLFGTQQVNGWETGYEIEESLDREKASLTVLAPGVRSGLIYKGMQFSTPSPDKPAHFEKGDEIILPLGIYYDDCTCIEEFFELFVKYRENYHKNEIINDLPLSVSFEKIKEKYNKWNWFSPKNYYRVGISKLETDGLNNAWQTGWVGGGMVTESFLIDGDKETRDRAAANLRFLFTEMSAPSGFIYGAYDGKRPVSDCFGEPHPYNMMLIRKSADILYFMMKQLPLLEERGYNIDYKENIQRLAQAFCDLWKKYGQFGQFIDVQTGEILIGNSLSAGSAMGGLALAYKYFGDEEYKKTAIESCDYYYKNYTQQGITNGGPGEIFGACDSESAGGILESYITMFNVFGDKKYIGYATSAANQLLSWVMNYDFVFPKESLFGRWNVKTSGSCFANVQNKHSAPGFCTLSGDSFFELYRITKNEIYLNAIRDTAHNITQYLITEQKQKIAPDTAGMITDTMNERVETSDWLEPLGEIFDGSCWCEVSDCLTYSEIPGLYIDKENDIICMIDHAEIKSVKNYRGAPKSLSDSETFRGGNYRGAPKSLSDSKITGVPKKSERSETFRGGFRGGNEKWQIELYNPTDYDMTLKIFSENKNYRGAPKSLSDSETNRGLQKIEHSEIFRSGFRGGKYRVDYLKDFEKINIKSKETATIEI